MSTVLTITDLIVSIVFIFTIVFAPMLDEYGSANQDRLKSFDKGFYKLLLYVLRLFLAGFFFFTYRLYIEFTSTTPLILSASITLFDISYWFVVGMLGHYRENSYLHRMILLTLWEVMLITPISGLISTFTYIAIFGY